MKTKTKKPTSTALTNSTLHQCERFLWAEFMDANGNHYFARIYGAEISPEESDDGEFFEPVSDTLMIAAFIFLLTALFALVIASL